MKWTPELSETVRAMHAAGVMPKDIGRKLGLTSNQVRGRLARMKGYQSVKDSDNRVYRAKPVAALRKRTNPLKDKGSWDSKTVLPYAQWKIWNQARRAANETKPKSVSSPNARHWTLRCDSPDNAECAFLIDDETISCCNPVAGGGSFGRRYCEGHLKIMLDIPAMERAKARRGVFTRPDTIRRNSTVLTTVWDEGRG